MPPPSLGFRNGRFVVDLRVAPGFYDWQQAGVVGEWQNLFRTHLPGGVFQFEAPGPATADAWFYRLNPVR